MNLINPPVEAELPYSLMQSQRGGNLIYFPMENGYMYSSQRAGKRVVGDNDGNSTTETYHNAIFRCQSNRHRGCSGRLLADKVVNISSGFTFFENLRVTIEHEDFCQPSPLRHIHERTSQMILNGVEHGDSFNNAYNHAVISGPQSLLITNPEAANSFPTSALVRTAQRRVAKLYPSVPTSINIDFPENWKHICGDISKDNFLLKNERLTIDGTAHTIIIFGRLDMVRLLCSKDTWYMDGTFKSCPDLFSQLFTIHFITSNRSIAALYCLLTGKMETLYTRLFAIIAELAVENNFAIAVTNVMVDFEIAIRNAIQHQWPNVTVNGCYFHYCQALYRKMSSLNLSVCLFILFDTFIILLLNVKHRPLTSNRKQEFVL